ncbi:hypothetical protein AB0O57_32275 [Streptomyces sp. NPDC091201]|uniref:hypothetical protein n=1 Tax=Streptomyces sp. NPDC091201 TaxID=3155190 RepID=UPI00342FDDA3
MESESAKRPLRKTSAEAAAHGGKLHELFGRQTTRTQKELAAYTSYHPSVITRFFSGERIAPKEFTDRLLEFTEAQGVSIGVDERAELDDLRRAAQEASGAHSAKAAYLRERIAELEREVARLTVLDAQRQESEAVDEELDEVAAATGQESDTAEPSTDIAGEIKALKEQIEELQRVLTEDILSGLVTGKAVDSPAVVHHHHHHAAPKKELGCAGLIVYGLLLTAIPFLVGVSMLTTFATRDEGDALPGVSYWVYSLPVAVLLAFVLVRLWFTVSKRVRGEPQTMPRWLWLPKHPLTGVLTGSMLAGYFPILGEKTVLLGPLWGLLLYGAKRRKEQAESS